MSDDFLSQIQATENKAAALIDKARDKAQKDLAKERQKLEADRQEKLAQAREIAKKSMTKEKDKNREVYEEEMKKGKKTAEKFEKDVAPKVKGLIPRAQAFFLNDLL